MIAPPIVKVKNMCEMGGMVLQDYAYYIAILGVVTGLSFVLGFVSGMRSL